MHFLTGARLAIIAVAFSASALQASTILFGVTAGGRVQTAVPVVYSDGTNQFALEAPNVVQQLFGTSGELQQSFYNVPFTPLIQTQSVAYLDLSPNANGLFNSVASASVNDFGFSSGVLSGWVAGSAGTADANFSAVTTTDTEARLIWQDTLFVSSATLPVGTAVQVFVGNSLSGSLALTGDSTNTFALDWIDVDDTRGYGSVSFHNTYTTPTVVNQEQTGIVTTYVGDTLTLEEQFGFVAAGQGDYTADANFSGFVRISPSAISLGATSTSDLADSSLITLISASGIDYTTVGTDLTAVPEPSGFLFVGLGLIGVVWIEKRGRSLLA